MSAYREHSPPPDARPTLWRAVRTHCGPELVVLAIVAYALVACGLPAVQWGMLGALVSVIVHLSAALALIVLSATGTLFRVEKALHAWRGHDTESE